MTRQLLLALPLALTAAACTDSGGSGTYDVAWHIVSPDGLDSTCEAQHIAQVKVTVTHDDTGESVVAMAPCADGHVRTGELGVGPATVLLDAIGTEGEAAGRERADVELTEDGQLVMVPEVGLQTLPLSGTLLLSWELRRDGLPITCEEAGATWVGIGVWLDDLQQGFSTGYSCNDEVGPFDLWEEPRDLEVSAQLYGEGDTPVGFEEIIRLEPTRGRVERDIIFNVP